jgi:hypothetical protein
MFCVGLDRQPGQQIVEFARIDAALMSGDQIVQLVDRGRAR